MARLRIGIIGTGRKKDQPDTEGFFMAYEHGRGYRALTDRCELVACADIIPEHAQAFAEAFGIDADGVYADYREMLRQARLDMVSICTWPHLHASMAVDCALAGVRAVHCEKPMASTWGAARLMAQECARRNVQLTFNHMRRFGRPFTLARDALADGAIGELDRIELGFPGDVYDIGTHWIDLCGMFVGERPATWVIGQIDYRHERRVFGMPSEGQALAHWQYTNGVSATLISGHGQGGARFWHRLVGTAGILEIGVPDEQSLRIRRDGTPWETLATQGETVHGAANRDRPDYHERAIADAVEALLGGREPELSAKRALNAAEIVFAIYESSRRRARVDMPLTIDDHPLVSMLETGDIRPFEGDA